MDDSKNEKDGAAKDSEAMSRLASAEKHCMAEVKKFDFYTYVAG